MKKERSRSFCIDDMNINHNNGHDFDQINGKSPSFSEDGFDMFSNEASSPQ